MLPSPPLRFLLLLLVMLGGCSSVPDEQRIVAAMDAMEVALEAGQPGDFMDHVAEEFSAGTGFDRRQLRATLVGLMVRNQRVSITRTGTEVTLHGDRATAVTTVLVLGGAGILPERSEHLRIESHWQKVGGDWVCFGARWE